MHRRVLSTEDYSAVRGLFSLLYSIDDIIAEELSYMARYDSYGAGDYIVRNFRKNR